MICRTKSQVLMLDLHIFENLDGYSMLFPISFKVPTMVFGGFKPSENMNVNGKDDIPYIMEFSRTFTSPVLVRLSCCAAIASQHKNYLDLACLYTRCRGMHTEINKQIEQKWTDARASELITNAISTDKQTTKCGRMQRKVSQCRRSRTLTIGTGQYADLHGCTQCVGNTGVGCKDATGQGDTGQKGHKDKGRSNEKAHLQTSRCKQRQQPAKTGIMGQSGSSKFRAMQKHISKQAGASSDNSLPKQGSWANQAPPSSERCTRHLRFMFCDAPLLVWK